MKSVDAGKTPSNPNQDEYAYVLAEKLGDASDMWSQERVLFERGYQRVKRDALPPDAPPEVVHANPMLEIWRCPRSLVEKRMRESAELGRRKPDGMKVREITMEEMKAEE